MTTSKALSLMRVSCGEKRSPSGIGADLIRSAKTGVDRGQAACGLYGQLALARQMRKPRPMAADPRTLLRSLFDAAVAAADPRLCVPPHLPSPPNGRTIVIGAGKAAAAMAA